MGSVWAQSELFSAQHSAVGTLESAGWSSHKIMPIGLIYRFSSCSLPESSGGLGEGKSCRGSGSPGGEQQQEGLGLCHAQNLSPAQARLLNGSRNEDLCSKPRFRLLSDSSVLALHLTHLSCFQSQASNGQRQDGALSASS